MPSPDGFNLVSVEGWHYDLQSIYAAYLGYFQTHHISWFNKTWGQVFASFEVFLSFGWPAVVVTDEDKRTGHVVTRMSTVNAFSKMIKTRFGETLPPIESLIQVRPFERSSRHLHQIVDGKSYRKLHSTIPAAMLLALKSRIRHGFPRDIQELWDAKDKSFLTFSFEVSEKSQVVLDAAYAALRCDLLEFMEVWPPVPEANYRKGHFVVQEYIDRIHNRLRPTAPWEYAFGESQKVPRIKLTEVLQAIIDSLASPDSDSIPNSLVIIGHNISNDMERLLELKIKIPSNVLVLDTSRFARHLLPPQAIARSGATPHGSQSVPLSTLLRTLSIPFAGNLHNSGNTAFLSLAAFQAMADPLNPLGPIPARPHNVIPRPRMHVNDPPVIHAPQPIPHAFNGTHPANHTRRNSGGNIMSSLRPNERPRTASPGAYGLPTRSSTFGPPQMDRRASDNTILTQVESPRRGQESSNRIQSRNSRVLDEPPRGYTTDQSQNAPRLAPIAFHHTSPLLLQIPLPDERPGSRGSDTTTLSDSGTGSSYSHPTPPSPFTRPSSTPSPLEHPSPRMPSSPLVVTRPSSPFSVSFSGMDGGRSLSPFPSPGLKSRHANLAASPALSRPGAHGGRSESPKRVSFGLDNDLTRRGEKEKERPVSGSKMIGEGAWIGGSATTREFSRGMV